MLSEALFIYFILLERLLCIQREPWYVQMHTFSSWQCSITVTAECVIIGPIYRTLLRIFTCTYWHVFIFILKYFAWVDQRAKVCLICHNVHLRYEECFIEWQQCFMKLPGCWVLTCLEFVKGVNIMDSKQSYLYS